ncbi:MAG: DUF4874 domain-containing protein [Clostridiales bacterium]|nr:DUF4874 domain-containing protein [Clostridiales bacterium]
MKKRWIRLVILVLVGNILSMTSCKKDTIGFTSNGNSSNVSSPFEASSQESVTSEPNGSASIQNSDVDKITETSKISSKIENATTSSGDVSENTVVVPLNKSYNFIPDGMTGDMSEKLLFNPGRGFRYEMAVSSVNEAKAFPERLESLMQDYTVESPRIVQLYIYLTDYRDKDLDNTMLGAIENMFAYCQSKKIQVLPRFAYVQDEGANATQDATIDQMLQHIDQFAPILKKYRNILFAIDAGMVMHWGEWSGGMETYTKYRPVLQKLIDATPGDLFVLVRYAAIKEMFAEDKARYSRLGYHDDYMVGYPHKWNTGGLETSMYYNTFLKNSANVIVQGEMPWGSDRTTSIGSGMNMAMYMAKFHFLAFSVYHNYREGGGQYAMVKWKSEQLTANSLSKNNLPYQESWFSDVKGGAYAQNAFNYIRDYTGYRIAAEQVKAEMKGKAITAAFTLKNYGFATPYSLSKGKLVIADRKGNIVSNGASWDVLNLKPQSTITVNAKLTRPDTENVYYIGVVITDRAGTPTRLANDAQYAKGVNLICPLVS